MIAVPNLKLFNTRSRKKEPLQPIEEGHVTLYTCGPTVYHYAHIGNFRTYVFEDLLRRTLKFFGLRVTQVMNLTDVDDKTIKGAIENGLSLAEYVKPYVSAFFEDLKSLNIEPAESYPAATDHMVEIVEMIAKLMDKGYAYQGSDGSIYYSIQKFPAYGCLSHLKMEDLQSGASQRISSDEYDKENISDFVLWKRYDPDRDGNIYWDSPWGKGRPGWHMECSAMAKKHLGETIDIHCGGVDNIFPHHENEIAQSEACFEKPFVNLWLHSEHLIVEGKKMSKSLGNFYTLRNLLDEGYSGRQVRYLLLQTHYKTQLNFTHEGLEAAKHALARIDDCVLRLQEIPSSDHESCSADPCIEKALTSFSDALADDLNISVALASIFDLIREVNTLCDQGKVDSSDAAKLLALFQRFDTVLGVFSFERALDTIPDEYKKMLEERNAARLEKNWGEADRLRDAIQEAGYVIEDGAEGSRLRKR